MIGGKSIQFSKKIVVILLVRHMQFLGLKTVSVLGLVLVVCAVMAVQW